MPDKLLSPEYGLSNSKLEECTANPSDVLNGKTFYSGDMNKKTGTLSLSGNANAGQVLSGSTFYSNSFTRQTGTMTNRGAWGTTINPRGSVTIPAGYHNGGGVVRANGTYRSPWEHRTSTGYTYDLSKFVSVPNHPEVKVRVDAHSYVWFVIENGIMKIAHNVSGWMWVDGYQYYFGYEEKNWNGEISIN